MKKVLCALALMASASLSAHAADDVSKLDSRLTAARNTINEIMSVPDKSIPDGITRQAVCIAVIPGVVKGAFILGAEYGQGVVTCRTHGGWSAPVFIRMAGGSFGFQIGGQSTDLILVAVNDRGFQDLLKNKFKIGGDASAAAGPVGRAGQASTDWKMNAEFLTYSRSQGLFAGIDLDGTVLSQNADDTRTEYGANISYNSVLHGDVPAGPNAVNFVHTVARYFAVSRENH